VSFNVKGFDGAVKLKHYSMMPDGKNYIAVVGKVSILGDSEVIDFEVKGSETANWIARVEGPGGSLNILGCQIEMIHQWSDGVPEPMDSTYYKVP
jgi:hypothetical protein